ncbi:unnamed protein product [Paramecium octaurelia]|uniref:Uncharacterized protein n=1 Tax=Paramecium octaurelia TaxID=43137 RepID=A0A8S1XBQ6_PAROT|nr:unnamed protein product [Paramecium octaurelia]CAD8198399.1 unnamed protein product [Paramecium octaurelia]
MNQEEISQQGKRLQLIYADCETYSYTIKIRLLMQIRNYRTS